MLHKSLLHRVQLVSARQPLNSGYFGIVGAVDQHQAGGNWLAVEQDSASAAVSFIAAFFSPSEMQFISKGVQQRVIWLHQKLPVFAVNGQLQRLFHLSY